MGPRQVDNWVKTGFYRFRFVSQGIEITQVFPVHFLGPHIFSRGNALALPK